MYKYKPRPHKGTPPHGESLTQQHFTKSCDINNILAKYTKTGVLDHINQHEENYHDCSAVDFHEAQNMVARATSMFAELPAETRSAFDNDPYYFLDYVQDPKNQDSLIDMGLATDNRPQAEPSTTSPPKTKDETNPSMDKSSAASNPEGM